MPEKRAKPQARSRDLHNPESAPWTSRVNKIVFVYNPRSSNAQRAQNWIDEICQKLQRQAVIIDITKTEPQEITAALHGVRKKDLLLLAIGGGDGTVHGVINAVLADTKIAHERICVLPLWGGNANDFSSMLNGLSSKTSASHILAHAKLVSVPLISLTLASARSQKSMYACCYVSFGASAHAAKQLDQKRATHRKLAKPLLLISELWTVVRALLTAPLHAISAGKNQYHLYEHMLVNGSRIAKVDKVPVRLGEPHFFYATLQQKSLGLFFRTALNILTRRPDTNWSKRSQLQFAINSPSPMQIDGEVLELNEPTKVHAAIYRPSLRFVSTRG